MKKVAGGIFLVIIVALGLSWWVWYPLAPVPPDLDLSESDPELAEILTAARQKVLQVPRSALAWGEMGMALRGAGFRAEATECLTQAERLDPISLRWPYLHGETLLQQDPVAAIDLLKRAWRLSAAQPEPDLTPAIRLVEAFRSQGDTDSADELLSQLRPRAPDHPLILYHSGMVAMSKGEFDEAKVALGRCLENPATRRKANIALAQVCRSLGQIEEADAYSRTTSTLPADLPWPDPHLAACFEKVGGRRARIERIERLESAGRYPEAIQGLRELLARGADYRFLSSLGKNLARVGELDEADRVLDQAIRLDPDAAQAYLHQARVSFSRSKNSSRPDNLRKAIEQATRGLERNPHDADGHVLLGRCHEGLGDLAKASTAFRKALGISPDLGEAHLHLGEILVRQGDREEGRRHLEQAARLARPGDDRAKKALEELGR